MNVSTQNYNRLVHKKNSGKSWSQFLSTVQLSPFLVIRHVTQEYYVWDGVSEQWLVLNLT